jgi:hypothetical protein
MAGNAAIETLKGPAVTQRALSQQLPEFIGVDRNDSGSPDRVKA